MESHVRKIGMILAAIGAGLSLGSFVPPDVELGLAVAFVMAAVGLGVIWRHQGKPN